MGYEILVTGGAGYLGSILVPELLQGGHRVTVLDNFMFRQHSLGHVCHHPQFQVVRGDVRDARIANPLYQKADIIFPLAALVGAPLCQADPVGATTTNKDALMAMFQTISPQQWVIMPNTNSFYGSGDANNFCDENSPLHPLSHYAQDKLDVEMALLARENAISFRLATVFGMAPRMRIDLLVNDFTYRAFHDRAIVLFESHFKRNYIHIRDVTRAFIHGMDHFPTMRHQAFNVGLSDANLSKKELCQVIQRHLPQFVFVEAPIGEDPDKRNYIVSNAKIEKAGFKPAFSLDFGVQELIKGFTMLRNSRYGNV